MLKTKDVAVGSHLISRWKEYSGCGEIHRMAISHLLQIYRSRSDEGNGQLLAILEQYQFVVWIQVVIFTLTHNSESFGVERHPRLSGSIDVVDMITRLSSGSFIVEPYKASLRRIGKALDDNERLESLVGLWNTKLEQLDAETRNALISFLRILAPSRPIKSRKSVVQEDPYRKGGYVNSIAGFLLLGDNGDDLLRSEARGALRNIIRFHEFLMPLEVWPLDIGVDRMIFLTRLSPGRFTYNVSEKLTLQRELEAFLRQRNKMHAPLSRVLMDYYTFDNVIRIVFDLFRALPLEWEYIPEIQRKDVLNELRNKYGVRDLFRNNDTTFEVKGIDIGADKNVVMNVKASESTKKAAELFGLFKSRALSLSTFQKGFLEEIEFLAATMDDEECKTEIGLSRQEVEEVVDDQFSPFLNTMYKFIQTSRVLIEFDIAPQFNSPAHIVCDIFTEVFENSGEAFVNAAMWAKQSKEIFAQAHNNIEQLRSSGKKNEVFVGQSPENLWASIDKSMLKTKEEGISSLLHQFYILFINASSILKDLAKQVKKERDVSRLSRNDPIVRAEKLSEMISRSFDEKIRS